MSVQALGAFERESGGDWVCFKKVEVSTPDGGQTVSVTKGARFHPHTVFAGFNDFTAYLESVSIESPSVCPHEH